MIDTRMYVHYAAALNWLVLTVSFTMGIYLFELDPLPVIVITLWAITVGNWVVYINGLMSNIDSLAEVTEKGNRDDD